MRYLVIFTSGFALASLLSVYFMPPMVLVVAGLVFAAASFGFVLIKGKNKKRYFLLCVGLSVGFLYCFVYAALFSSPAAQLQEKDIQSRVLICSYPQEYYGGDFCTVKIINNGAPDIKAKLYASNGLDVRPGDIVTVNAFAKSAKDDGIYSSGILLNLYATDISLESSGNYNLSCIGSIASKYIKDVISRAFPADTAPFATALITGDKAGLAKSTALYNALQDAGLAHIIAVSGMHLSFVMSMLGVIIKSRRRMSVLGIPLIIFFMAFTGFSPSVCRAGIMYIFILSANFVRRESDSLTSLFAALLVLIIFDPYSVASVSMQLSFLASLGIILMSGRMYRRICAKLSLQTRLLGKLLHLLTSIFSVTASALIFTIPVTAVYFGYVSLLAPVTALVVMGILSLTFTLCAVSCALGLLWIPAGAAIAGVASIFLRFVSGVAVLVSRIPYSVVYTSNIWIAVWLSCTYLIMITAFISKLSAKRLLLPICLSVIALCAAIVLPNFFTKDTKLSMTAIDVGQGQCIVLSSGGCTAVIDCGSSSETDAGSTAINYLHSKGIDNVDILVLTHYHADHINGADERIADFGVSTLIIPPPEDSIEQDDKIIDLANSLGDNIIYTDHMLSVSFGSSMLYVYPPVASESENERCSAVLCSENDFDILVTGDMPDYCEMQLIDTWQLPDIEVLVAGHHGSASSTSTQLLEAVRPETVVISVGENSYGHPSDELLLRLSQYGAAVFRTDTTGNITISSSI